MARGTASDIDVLREIHQLVEDGHGPSQIQRELDRNRLFDGRVPSLSTITRIVREAKQTDRSDPWDLMEADSVEARAVLEVLPFIIETTEGRSWPTRDLAARLTCIRLAAPLIPVRQNYILARLYQHHEALGLDTKVLDLWLAARVWESDEASRRFLQLLRLGRSEDEVNLIKLRLVVYAEVIGDPAKEGADAGGTDATDGVSVPSSMVVDSSREENNRGKATR
jgi:hypothetical protein